MTNEQAIANEIMRRNVADHKAESPEAARIRRATVCSRCQYQSSEQKAYGTCEYLAIEGHIRPCAPCKCVETGVFKEGKPIARRKDLSLRTNNRIFLP